MAIEMNHEPKFRYRKTFRGKLVLQTSYVQVVVGHYYPNVTYTELWRDADAGDVYPATVWQPNRTTNHAGPM